MSLHLDSKQEFSDLYEQHKGYVTRVACSVLRYRRDIDADDICQDVFVKALTHMESFKWDASFRTWITSITINHCLGLMRKKALRPNESIDDLELQSPYRVNCHRYELQRLMDKLTPHRREAIELHCIMGFSAEECAMIMGVSTAAAKSASFTGKRSLKEHASVL
jgi:RNA polymerase sigma-70 factor (ECF subfamily)